MLKNGLGKKIVDKLLKELYSILKDIDEKHILVKDLQEEITLFRRFFELHDEKLDKIGSYVNAWEKGNLDKIKEDIVQEIFSFNKQLTPLLLKLFNLEERDKAVLHMVVVSRGLNVKNVNENFLTRLQEFFTKIQDNLRFLRAVLLRQNKYIKENDLFGGRLVADIEKHAGFYTLLVVESNTDNTVRQIIGHIIEETDNEFERKERFRISHLRFTEELLNPNSVMFNKFYHELYSKSFTADELDSKTWMRTYARLAYQLRHMRENHARTHLLAIKEGEQLVGGILVEFIPVRLEEVKKVLKQKNKLSALLRGNRSLLDNVSSLNEKMGVGVGWYTITDKQKRRRGIGTKLFLDSLKLLMKDASVLGYPFKGRFAEVNSPALMSNSQIAEDKAVSMDPYVRLRYFKSLGLKTILCRYVQPELEGCERCDYLYLRIWTNDPVWSRGIPVHEYLPAIYCFMKYGIEVPSVENNEDFLDIIRDILDKNKILLYEINDKDDTY